MTRISWFLIVFALLLIVAYALLWHYYGRQIVTPFVVGPDWRAINLAPIPWYQNPQVLVKVWIVAAAAGLFESARLYYRKPQSAFTRTAAPLMLLSTCSFLMIVAGQLLLAEHAELWLTLVLLATAVPLWAIFLKLMSRQPQLVPGEARQDSDREVP